MFSIDFQGGRPDGEQAVLIDAEATGRATDSVDEAAEPRQEHEGQGFDPSHRRYHLTFNILDRIGAPKSE
jgi:hypothetical protein